MPSQSVLANTMRIGRLTLELQRLDLLVVLRIKTFACLHNSAILEREPIHYTHIVACLGKLRLITFLCDFLRFLTVIWCHSRLLTLSL